MRVFPGTSSRRPRGAFTLLELLVTIAIIASLDSLGLSSLGTIKRKVAGVTCLNNLRQVGMALTMYADDYHGLLPSLSFRDDTNLVQGNRAWDVPVQICEKLLSYGATRRILGCPTRGERLSDGAWNYSTNYRVIGYCIATRGAPRVRKANTFYSLTTLAPIIRDEFQNAPELSSSLVAPTVAVLVADPIISAGSNTNNRALNKYSGLGGGYLINGKTVEHGAAHLYKNLPERCNAFFADGHAARKSFLDTIPRTEREPTFWW